MSFSSRAFFHNFRTEFEKEAKQTDWIELWDKLGDWTTKMLGDGQSRKKGDYGIIGNIGQKFGFEVQAEWKQIDQAWSYYYKKPKGWTRAPWKLEVVIEHENKGELDDFLYTLIKFEELTAPLNIGIFYPGDDADEWLQICHDFVIKQISKISWQAYLIIFGFLDEENKKIEWEAYEIDPKGNIIPLQ